MLTVLLVVLASPLSAIVQAATDLASNPMTERLVSLAATALYYASPTTHPLSTQRASALRTLRIVASDWECLAASLAYGAVLLAFCWATTAAVLVRRRLV